MTKLSAWFKYPLVFVLLGGAAVIAIVAVNFGSLKTTLTGTTNVAACVTDPTDKAIIQEWLQINNYPEIHVVCDSVGKITTIDNSSGNPISKFGRIMELTNLVDLQIPDNALTGAIPTLPPHLWRLTIYNNKLTALPSSLPPTLQTLHIDNNELAGTLPPLPASLQFLTVPNNKLCPPYPERPANAYNWTILPQDTSGCTGATVPPAPTNLTCTPGDRQVTLKWDAVSGAVTYWATINGVDAAASSSVTMLAFIDLTNGTAYTYKIRARNISDGAFSQYSNSVTCTPTATTSGVSGVTVSPASATVAAAYTRQFSTTCSDASGKSVACGTVTWTASKGSISSSGLYTAPSTTGPATVTATANGKSGTAQVTIVPVAPTGPVCGDRVCEGSETATTCATDCAAKPVGSISLLVNGYSSTQSLPKGSTVKITWAGTNIAQILSLTPTQSNALSPLPVNNPTGFTSNPFSTTTTLTITGRGTDGKTVTGSAIVRILSDKPGF